MFSPFVTRLIVNYCIIVLVIICTNLPFSFFLVSNFLTVQHKLCIIVIHDEVRLFILCTFVDKCWVNDFDMNHFWLFVELLFICRNSGIARNSLNIIEISCWCWKPLRIFWHRHIRVFHQIKLSCELMIHINKYLSYSHFG